MEDASNYREKLAAHFEKKEEEHKLLLNGRVRLTKDERGLWVDKDGTVYDIADAKLSRDDEVRAGVGIFSLSKQHLLSKAAGPHDHAYSSQAYQLFHFREEADEMYLEHVVILGEEERNRHAAMWGSFASAFLSAFGPAYWENEKTVRRPALKLKFPNEQGMLED